MLWLQLEHLSNLPQRQQLIKRRTKFLAFDLLLSEQLAKHVTGLEVVEGGSSRLPGRGGGEVGEDFEDFEAALRGVADLAVEVGLGGVEFDGDFGPGVRGDGGEIGSERGTVRGDADEGAGGGDGEEFDLHSLRVENDDGLRIGGFGEAQRDWRAAVADGVDAGDALRSMQMAEGGVVEAVEEVGAYGSEVADVDVAFAVAGGGTEDGEVAHGDDGSAIRDGATRCELRSVVGADGGADLLVHSGDGFTGGSLAEIALAQKRHGGHDGSTEIDDVVSGVAEDMHVEALQQFARGIEVRGGVVVAASDDGLHVLEIGEALQEVEVERDGILRRIGSIEDVAADEQRVDVLVAQRVDEPVEKRSVLRQAITLDESSAEMPVCGVEEFHSGCWMPVS